MAFFIFYCIAFCKYEIWVYICAMQNDKNTYKVLNTKTNETFDATLWSEKKASYLIHFNGGLVPFSKKTGKLYGKNLFGRNILHLHFYQLITIVNA